MDPAVVVRVVRSYQKSAVIIPAVPAVAASGPICSDGGYEKRWLWEQAGGNNIGQACYWDSGNHLNIDDQEQDGHSLVLHLRNPSNGNSWTYWDSGSDWTPWSRVTG